jgi:hypothetical protein
MQPLFNILAQTIICLNLASKYCVSADLWTVKDIQERDPRWLRLVADIRVPAHTTVSASEEASKVICVACFGISVHDVEFWEAFGRARRRMDVMAAKMASKI